MKNKRGKWRKYKLVKTPKYLLKEEYVKKDIDTAEQIQDKGTISAEKQYDTVQQPKIIKINIETRIGPTTQEKFSLNNQLYGSKYFAKEALYLDQLKKIMDSLRQNTLKFQKTLHAHDVLRQAYMKSNGITKLNYETILDKFSKKFQDLEIEHKALCIEYTALCFAQIKSTPNQIVKESYANNLIILNNVDALKMVYETTCNSPYAYLAASCIYLRHNQIDNAHNSLQQIRTSYLTTSYNNIADFLRSYIKSVNTEHKDTYNVLQDVDIEQALFKDIITPLALDAIVRKIIASFYVCGQHKFNKELKQGIDLIKRYPKSYNEYHNDFMQDTLGILYYLKGDNNKAQEYFGNNVSLDTRLDHYKFTHKEINSHKAFINKSGINDVIDHLYKRKYVSLDIPTMVYMISSIHQIQKNITDGDYENAIALSQYLLNLHTYDLDTIKITNYMADVIPKICFQAQIRENYCKSVEYLYNAKRYSDIIDLWFYKNSIIEKNPDKLDNPQVLSMLAESVDYSFDLLCKEHGLQQTVQMYFGIDPEHAELFIRKKCIQYGKIQEYDKCSELLECYINFTSAQVATRTDKISVFYNVLRDAGLTFDIMVDKVDFETLLDILHEVQDISGENILM